MPFLGAGETLSSGTILFGVETATTSTWLMSCEFVMMVERVADAFFGLWPYQSQNRSYTPDKTWRNVEKYYFASKNMSGT